MSYLNGFSGLLLLEQMIKLYKSVNSSRTNNNTVIALYLPAPEDVVINVKVSLTNTIISRIPLQIETLALDISLVTRMEPSGLKLVGSSTEQVVIGQCPK